MTDRNVFYKSLTKIAFGYLIIFISISIMGFDILPDFVGYILFLSAFLSLAEKYRNFRLLEPLAVVLMVWSIIAIALPFLSEIEPVIYITRIASIIISIINLYFNFQLLSEISAVAREYQSENMMLDKRLIKLRNADTVVFAALQLLSTIPFIINFSETPVYISIMTVLTLVLIVITIIIAYTLFCVRRLFKDDGMTPKATNDDSNTENSTKNFNGNSDEA